MIFLYTPAVTWLKYCRYGVKHYPINQSINPLHASYQYNLRHSGAQKQRWGKIWVKYVSNQVLYALLY